MATFTGTHPPHEEKPLYVLQKRGFLLVTSLICLTVAQWAFAETAM